MFPLSKNIENMCFYFLYLNHYKVQSLFPYGIYNMYMNVSNFRLSDCYVD